MDHTPGISDSGSALCALHRTLETPLLSHYTTSNMNFHRIVTLKIYQGRVLNLIFIEVKSLPYSIPVSAPPGSGGRTSTAFVRSSPARCSQPAASTGSGISRIIKTQTKSVILVGTAELIIFLNSAISDLIRRYIDSDFHYYSCDRAAQ